MAWPRSTSGGWRYWWTRRTTWWSAAGGCIPPELDQGDFLSVRKAAPEALRKPLERIQRAWNEPAKTQADDYQAYDEPRAEAAPGLAERGGGDQRPARRDSRRRWRPALQEFYFAIPQFGRLAELFGEHSLFDIEKRPGRNGRSLAQLCLRNVVPAAFLAERFAASRSHRAVLRYPRAARLLRRPARPAGGHALAGKWTRHSAPSNWRCTHTASGFHALCAAPGIPGAHRSDSRRGSFASGRAATWPSSAASIYLRQALDVFRQAYPWVPCWSRTPRMDEAERRVFLERFVTGGEGIGFAVLGVALRRRHRPAWRAPDRRLHRHPPGCPR